MASDAPTGWTMPTPSAIIEKRQQHHRAFKRTFWSAPTIASMNS